MTDAQAEIGHDDLWMKPLVLELAVGKVDAVLAPPLFSPPAVLTVQHTCPHVSYLWRGQPQ